MKKIGLIGGISWTSTIDYYKFINEGVNQKLGGLNSAEIVIDSINFASIQKVGWKNSYDLLLKSATKLKNYGVDTIVLCANTAHLFKEKLENQIQIPIISIISATANKLKINKLKTVALLGTKYTMELDFYKKKLASFGFEIIIPEKESVRDKIQHIVKNELGKGDINKKSKDFFLSTINELINDGAEGVIFGCTEIPLLLNQSDVSIPIFNTTEIHSKEIVKYILK